MIPLIKDTIDNKDIDQLIEWLKTYPKLTKGDNTLKLEKIFADWIGTKYSVFVNSGSSANLLMLYALKYLKGDNLKVAVPSLCWATDLSPVMQLDMSPILVDCNLNDLSVDLNHLKEIFNSSNKPDVLLLVAVLGLSPNMKLIKELCDEYNVILLEDVCESMGSKYQGNYLGSFGFASFFSMYFGHHLSTIEGGFINTNDEDFYYALLMMRSHGWDRDLPEHVQEKLREENNVSEFDSLYTFYLPLVFGF